MPNLAKAQTAQQVFGRNRVQYKQAEWKFLTSPHFEVYFSPQAEPAARAASVIAEREYDRITDLIGYSPYNRIRIYLYDSPLRLSESNVGLEQNPSLLGGKTSFLKSIVEVSYGSTTEQTRSALARGLARCMIYDMMYGGSFTEAVQNSYLMMLPDWFTEGAVAYAADGYSLTLDDLARDGALSRRLRRPSAKTGAEAEWMGQSVWAYMADKYGRASVSNALNLTRIIRNEETAISSTLGIGFNRFLRDWRDFYKDQADQAAADFAPLPDSAIVKAHINNREEIFGIALSPNGRYAAWASHDEGRVRVRMKDLRTGRQHKLWAQGERHYETKSVPMSPVAFAGNDRVVTVHHNAKGDMELLTLSLSGKVIARSRLVDIDHVTGLAFSRSGGKGVITAVKDGRPDLFQVNPKTGKVRPLTNSAATEQDPELGADGDTVYFASDLSPVSDSIPLSSGERAYARRMRIFKLPLASNAQPQLVAAVPGGNLTQPLLHPELGLVALSDASGTLNLVRPDTGRPAEIITAYRNNIQAVSIDSRGRVLLLGRSQGRTRLARLDTLHLLTEQTTLQTAWRQAHPFRKRERIATAPKPVTTPASLPTSPTPQPPAGATLTAPAGASSTQSTSKPATNGIASAQPVVPPAPPRDLDPEVDFRNYIFEDEKLPTPPAQAQAPALAAQPFNATPAPAQQLAPPAGTPIAAPPQPQQPAGLAAVAELRQGKQLIQQAPVETPIVIQGPFKSVPRLSSSAVSTSFTVDPYRGWGLLMEVALSDYHENHRFQVKAMPFLDLRSSVLQMDYAFLKYRVDFGARFFRNSYYITEIDPPVNYLQKNNLYRYELSASYPISRSLRVSLHPNFFQTNYINLAETGLGGINGDKTRNYLGARLEAVYDNSFTSPSNITTGTKARIVVENNAGLTDKQFGFGSVLVDLRRYQRVHKEITLALRASGGRFFGPSKKQYLLGGMDNWVFYQWKNLRPSDPSFGPSYAAEGHTSWFFNQFVTNMRGFDYGAMYGNNFVLLNAELRIPLVKYLYKGPIASNFLRNFQLIGFTDVGSAWSGGSLLSRNNSINQSVETQYPITITTYNNKSPFLVGYGAGVRTMILGYYAKFDVAFGQQDNKVQRRLYLTLGYDF